VRYVIYIYDISKLRVKTGPLVFLLKMFVITENIMKHPVQFSQKYYVY
jgi:hypothetical protein